MNSPIQSTMPRSSGLGRKLTGRVAPVTNITASGTPAKTAGYIPGVSGPVEFGTRYVAEEATKTAFTIPESVKTVGIAAGTSAATALAGAALAGVGSATFNAARKRFVDKPEFERSFNKSLEINPSLKSYPEDMLRAYFNLVCQASPTVAKNPLLASQYLKHLLSYQGSMNFNAFSDLTKLEGQILKNDNDSNLRTNVAEKALIETVLKNGLKSGGRSSDTEKALIDAIIRNGLRGAGRPTTGGTP